jgi:hypothetical protein
MQPYGGVETGMGMGMETVENGYSNDKCIDGRTTRATYCLSGRQDRDMLRYNDCGYPVPKSLLGFPGQPPSSLNRPTKNHHNF